MNLLNFLENIRIPDFVIFLFVAATIFSFMLWREKKRFSLTKENVFDLLFLFFISSIIIGRIFYIVENFNQFRHLSWSFYPYYFLHNSERVWFKQMPWVLFRFWDNGLNYSGMLLGGLVSLIILKKQELLKTKSRFLVIQAIVMSQLALIIVFYWKNLYWGKETDLFFGVRYSLIDEAKRIPLQLIELVVLLMILLGMYVLKKYHIERYIVGMYLFFFFWLEIIIQFFTARETVNTITFSQYVYLLIVFFSIISLVYTARMEKKPEETINVPVRRFLQSEGSSLPQRGDGEGYHQYQASFSSYQQKSQSIFEIIKRKVFRLRRKYVYQRTPKPKRKPF